MRKSFTMKPDEKDDVLLPEDNGVQNYGSNENETADAVEYTKNQAKKGLDLLKDFEIVKNQRKECFQPGIDEIEKLIVKSPMSTTSKQVFRYELSLNNYDVSHYENYKANNLRKEDITKVLYDLSINVQYYRIDDIRVEKNSIYKMFMLVILAFLQCQFIDWVMFDLVAFIFNCLIFICTSCILMIVRKKQRKIVTDKYKKRHNTIKQHLTEINQQETFFLNGVCWKTGTMSAWQELHLTKMIYGK